MKSIWLSALLLACVVLAMPRQTQAQGPHFGNLTREFDYDDKVLVGIQEVGQERRGAVTVIDLTYASPLGGRVPAYLVVPSGRGPFAAILFGHWMMEGSPLKNRGEFLEEAVVLARSGAVSLLIDAPYIRPGFEKEKDELRAATQSAEVSRQQLVDFRRGIDLLTARPDVDPKRIAYVGHSFDAHVGGILCGVEKRIGWFVLMAGGFADEEYVFDPENVEMQKLRERIGEDNIREYFRVYAWDDPIHFAGHSGPAAVFLQYGRKDQPISEKMARRYYTLFAEPKQIGFYDAGHALNAEARLERAQWLAKQLSLKSIDKSALARIPELK